MIKKLLFVIALVCSVNAFAQATANPAPDLSQCGNEVFNLTTQTPIILGAQSPNDFTVGYFVSMADATANVNQISNAAVYIAPQSQVIYARVTNTTDSTFDITSFTISWNTLNVMTLGNIQACMSFTLPPIPVSPQSATANYYTAPGGTGTLIPVGSEITTSQTIYIYASNGICTDETQFIVTIFPQPVLGDFPDVTACGSYVLPALNIGQYFTGPNGTGSAIPPGYVITASQTVYVSLPNAGPCQAEESFVVTILNAPENIFPPSVSACTEYVLPEPPAGYFYFADAACTVPVPMGITFTASTTIYIRSTTGPAPSCTATYPLSIEIGNPQIGDLPTFEVCDSNGDGFAAFDLNSISSMISNNLGNVASTFYETQTDAELGVNSLTSPYMNILPNNETIWVRIQSILGGCYTVVPLELAITPCTTISGIVRLDTDNNGCTTDDPPASGITIICIHNNDIQYAYTNEQGEYQFTNVQQGVNVINVVQNIQLNGGLATPTAHTFDIVTAENYTQDFCITPVESVNDASVTLVASTGAVPGFPVYYGMVVQNVGNTVLDGSVTLEYDNTKVTFASSNPGPTSTTANTLTFNFSNLQPSNTRYISLTFNVLPPPTVQSGVILGYIADVTTTQTDLNQANNHIEMYQTVTNSYDPNDISVNREQISASQIDEDLYYTVRFQNMGTSNAVNVRIENTLPDDLDWSTFRPITASHGFTAEREGDHVVFKFNNINLPAEQDDEPGSHGYIIYAAKPISTFESGDGVIDNYADIYFDFNPSIKTNTAHTYLVILGNEEHDLNAFTMYPNPTSGRVNIRFAEVLNDVSISMVDIQGKQILEQSAMQTNEANIDVSNVQSGLYFVKIEADGKSVTKKLIVR